MTQSEPDHTIIERRDPLVGNLLDHRFRIDARLAAGGFGAIYRATDVRSNHEVALKVLHGNLAADPLIVARFRREGEMLASLRDPHTVTAYELGEAADGTLYIAMELLRGETLYDAYKEQGGSLPWRRVTAIARAVCSSLAEAHDRGIVHRDLKPANIHLQERDGKRDFVKVLDFGIAKVLRGGEQDEAELTQAGQMIGTFDYMAPEQMLGGAVGAGCDIYTLGVVMYEMITGRLPFADATSPTHLLAMLLTTTPPPVASLVPVPPALDRAIMRCLEREPADRFGSVIEVAEALEGVLAELGAPEGPTLADRPLGDEPTWVGQRAEARGTAPAGAPPRLAEGPPTHLTPTRAARLRDAIAPVGPIEPLPVRAQGSQPSIATRAQPPMRATLGGYDVTVPARGLAARERARGAQPRVEPRASQPVPPAHAVPQVQPALEPSRTAWPELGSNRTPRPVLDPSLPARPVLPYPIAGARGSQPFLDPRALQPALAAGSPWQHLHLARRRDDSGGFDPARDAAVRRAVWVLVLVLGSVLALVVANLL